MRSLKGISSFALLLLILAVAVVLAVVVHFGNGGPGDRVGNSNTTAIPAIATEQTTQEITTHETTYVDITVAESKYIFNNTSYELDDIDNLISDVKLADEKITVRITDETASEQAYKTLIHKLDNEKIRYINAK